MFGAQFQLFHLQVAALFRFVVFDGTVLPAQGTSHSGGTAECNRGHTHTTLSPRSTTLVGLVP